VTVLTGPLGAGKTTLLNHIMTQVHGRRFAVIVNEFGALGIDGDLVVGADEDVITLANGCVCCTVRGDLVATITALVARGDARDGIIVETTGLADPAPVAQTFFASPVMDASVRLDAIVTVVDAHHLLAQLGDVAQTERQIAAADLVLVNKVDLVGADRLAQIEVRVRAINRFADVHCTDHARLPVDILLDRHGFDLARVIERMPAVAGADDHHHHADAVTSLSLVAEAPLEQDRFLRWADNLLAGQGDDILRVKGILRFAGADRPFVFQAVHRIMDGDFIGHWPEGARHSRLVVIGRHLDPQRLRRNFAACQVGGGRSTASYPRTPLETGTPR